MEIINLLGVILAQKIDISQAAARGLLKLSIKDELGPFKSYDEISLQNLKSVIENSLKRRLVRLEVSDLENLIQILVNVLIENQSLITISKV